MLKSVKILLAILLLSFVAFVFKTQHHIDDYGLFSTTVASPYKAESVALNTARAEILKEQSNFGSDGWPKCDNYKDIQNFVKPIPIVWLVKFNGCVMSCQGGFFIRIKEDAKYPHVVAYMSDGEKISKEFQNNGLVLKITGEWGGIGDDYQTAFNNKCVPIINIKKIETVPPKINT